MHACMSGPPPSTRDKTKCFGKALRLVQFGHHSSQLCRLNNGSFGACPAVVLAAQQQVQAEWLQNPDDFWHSLGRRFQGAQEAIAEGLFQGRLRSSDLAVLDNVTVAVSVLIHSVVANITAPRSVIVLSSLTYPAVRNAVLHGIAQAQAKGGLEITVLTVQIPFPLVAADPSQALVHLYREALAGLPAGHCIALACLDHVSSLPCLRIPVRELVQLLRESGAREVLVDGAHGPGQLDLAAEVPLMGADYYAANLHKWMFTPAAAGFLWVSPSAPSRPRLHHPVVSHSYSPAPPSSSSSSASLQGEDHFALPAECAMLGTRDYSAMLVLPAALAFAQSLGGLEAIRERNSLLCSQAASLLCLAWDSSTSPRDPEDAPAHSPPPPPPEAPLASYSPGLTRPSTMQAEQGLSMAMVGLPPVLGDSPEHGEDLRLALRDQHLIVVQKCVAVPGDRLYLRISCAVYNHWGEFEGLRDAVLQLAAKKQRLLVE